MSKTFVLTANELNAAMILVKSCLYGMGGKRPSDLEHDEYTWVNPKDLIDAGFSKHEAAGTWSALMDKGVVQFWDETEERGKEYILATEAWKYLDTIWGE